MDEWKKRDDSKGYLNQLKDRGHSADVHSFLPKNKDLPQYLV